MDNVLLGFRSFSFVHKPMAATGFFWREENPLLCWVWACASINNVAKRGKNIKNEPRETLTALLPSVTPRQLAGFVESQYWPSAMEQGLRSNAIYRVSKSQRCKGESAHAQTDTRMKMHRLFGFLLMLPQKLWVRGGKRAGRRLQQDNATEGLFRWRPKVQFSTLGAEVVLNKSSERYWWWTSKRILDLFLPGFQPQPHPLSVLPPADLPYEPGPVQGLFQGVCKASRDSLDCNRSHINKDEFKF